jgi:2'-5' RNA ligase
MRTLNQPLVLAGGKDGNAELKAFHRLLVAKLSGRSDVNLKFTPHMTLLYDREINEEPVSPQVSWTVGEIVLVLSHVGATKYDRLGCWKLGA